MKIKKYLAESMTEAIQVIKEDMGPDALIVNSCRVREKGWKGFFRPRLWKVTAAVDQAPPVGQTAAPRELIVKQEDLQKEIAEIKTMLKLFSRRQEENRSNPADADLTRWREILAERGVSSELTEMFLKDVETDTSLDEEKFDGQIQSDLVKTTSFALEPLYRNELKKKVQAFIGPTGVGKTTTIAKLAARYALLQHRKIGIITIDTFRVGAVEQLKIYGDIIGAPVEVVISPKELREAVDKHCDKDMVLIDTSGHSYKNAMQLGTLKGFLKKIPEAEIFLVLSTTTKEEDLAKTIENFGGLGFSRFIFTKADETGSLGNVLNLALSSRIPVEYITNGQNVPNDIVEIRPKKLAQMVFGGEGS